MRAKLSLCFYMLLVEVVGFYLVVVPVYAFQVSSSTTGYVRTLNASGASAMLSSARPAQLSSVASAASVGGASLAIRLVAGLGWVGLGVSVGLLLYQLYYNQADLALVKAGATVPGGFTVPGSSITVDAHGTCPGGHPSCLSQYDQFVSKTVVPVGFCSQLAYLGTGWTAWGAIGGVGPCLAFHFVSSPQTAGVTSASPVPTAAEINNWLSTRPANDPLSIQSHTAVAGVGSTTQTADQVVTQPVSASEVLTQVVPATSIGPTDVVVNKDATAPAGPVPTQTATQTSTSTNTTTTTTITNPDGSTTTTSTKTETEEAPVSSCSTGNHEQRTFGGILQDHMDLWKGSGLLSALNLLKTLTWPTAIPTYSLQSNLLGNFTLDFSAWSGMLTAIRSIIIAIAGFVAYRMIFVGAR